MSRRGSAPIGAAWPTHKGKAREQRRLAAKLRRPGAILRLEAQAQARRAQQAAWQRQKRAARPAPGSEPAA